MPMIMPGSQVTTVIAPTANRITLPIVRRGDAPASEKRESLATWAVSCEPAIKLMTA